MARFPAPANALTPNDVETLINSGTIWTVCGSALNPSKSEHYVMSSDQIDDNGNIFIEVQNVYRNDNDTVTRFNSSIYLGDRNMDAKGSTNDNYVFLNEEDADNAVEYFKKCWAENPKMREEREAELQNGVVFTWDDGWDIPSLDNNDEEDFFDDELDY